MNHELQNFIKVPRKEGTVQPAVDNTVRSTRDDGKLYRMVDHKDFGKYHVLTESELRDEARKAQESAVSILEMGSQIVAKKPKSPVKTSAGTKKMRQEKNIRKKAVAAAVAAEAELEDNKEEDTTADMILTGQPLHGGNGGFGIPMDSNERINSTTAVIKEKYEQNLKVVDILFEEKKSLESRVMALETALEDAGLDVTQVTRPDTAPDMIDVPTGDTSVMPGPMRSTSPTAASKRNNKVGTTARSMSAVGGSRNKNSKSATSSGSPSRGKVGMSANQASQMFGPGGISNKMNKKDRHDLFVAKLQASVDNHKQKKLNADEKERQKKLDHDKYMREQAERRKRAKNAGPFTDMMKRQEEAAELQKEKMEKKKKETDDKERKEAEARRKKRLDHINKELPKNELTWKEMEAEKAAARKEKVEKRALELQMKSKAPAMTRYDDRPKKDILDSYKPFKAEDPARVKARLDMQKQRWDQKQKELEVQKGARSRMTPKDYPFSPLVQSMDQRTLEQEKRKERRQREIKRMNDEKIAARQERERRELEKLMNSKVPESSRKMTASVKKRAEMVRKKMEDEELEKQKEKLEDQKRKNTLKAMGSVMKNVIEENEIRRKSQVPGYVELSGSEERAAILAREARENFREKFRANKKRLDDIVSKRPTLIERLDQTTTANNAANNALKTLKNAMGEELGQGDVADDDLFDEYEKMKLGL